jgi:hypothetical protein
MEFETSYYISKFFGPMVISVVFILGCLYFMARTLITKLDKIQKSNNLIAQFLMKEYEGNQIEKVEERVSGNGNDKVEETKLFESQGVTTRPMNEQEKKDLLHLEAKKAGLEKGRATIKANKADREKAKLNA